MSKQIIHISLPIERRPEAEWICSFIFGDYLGLSYEISSSQSMSYSLQYKGHTLTLPDIFFSEASKTWLSRSTLPDLPLKSWDVSTSIIKSVTLENTVPILFGNPGFEIYDSGDGAIEFDILGSAFFMLSRYEELVVKERDEHERFSSNLSTAKYAGFIERPIIDEYIEILWVIMKIIWPSLQRQSKQGHIHVTCDVDTPFDCAAKNIARTARVIGGDLLKRYDIKAASKRLMNYVCSRLGNYRFDSNNTFGWYMDICEKAGLKAKFYFVSEHSSKTMDGCYKIDEPWIIKLIQSIGKRGHEIGVHASYNTYRDGIKVIKERQRMIEICKYAGVDSSVRGNRQHFLRWEAACTPDLLDAAGFEYDTTGAFADAPGFRYGTAHPFSMWSWERRGSLNLQQRPLVFMERSIISKKYMGFGHTEKSLEKMLMLKRRALVYGGDFTFLWHNSHFEMPQDKEFFAELIR